MKNIQLYNGNCLDFINDMDSNDKILVIDPPFNIGYRYNTYKDKMKHEEYLDFISNILDKFDKFVVVHYPETMFEIALRIKKSPNRVIQWVYNSNTRRQHRSIAFWGFEPDFSKIKQPYKNPNDKRVKKLIESGSQGTNIYDWWNINQVKNVSKEKTGHPCQMPIKVLENIISLLPENYTIVDCFMGSGTTGVACKNLNRRFIGIELDEKYFNIAKERIESI